LEIESEAMGTNHVLAGALLAVRWQLPEIITNGIRYHHMPLKAREMMLPSIINLVNALIQDNFEEDWYDDKLAEMIKLNVEDVSDLREEILKKGNLLLNELS